MEKENNLLIEALRVLSSSSNDQIKYLNKIFGNRYFNVDEILLEYEDAKFLQDHYNESIQKMLLELEVLLEKIDEDKLYNINDLDSSIWNQARKKSKSILQMIING